MSIKKEKEVVTGEKPVVKEKTLELPESTLKALVEKIDALQKQSDKQNEMLLAVADKSRLSNYNIRNQGSLVKTARITLFDGKLVVGWKSVIDEVMQDPGGRWIVNQQTELMFQDGTSKIVSIKNFEFQKKQEVVEVVGEIVDNLGNHFYKLQRKNGETIELGDSFIN
ncbi:MAG: hypothetical protein WC269_01390 [Candidatus Gracilibacteria bacterium]|jgi:hypothetical protein